MMEDDELYDQCYECRGLGDDYMTDEFGEQISMCETCPMNPYRQEEDE